ncbi:hypothetical protein M9H77_04608 [Catharanthus roseus]|uniref:Uncharacterized protein n=1 Tax=Catharanthus roseus TaxID=4058 RepID=A0ACC0CEQ2_CATRO|nr:hypothetical protein M9H77_04608 [Catharanthus roseus]
MFVAHFADPFTKLWKLGGIFLKAMTFLLSEISLIYIQGYVCRLGRLDTYSNHLVWSCPLPPEYGNEVLPVMVETVSSKILEHIPEQCLICCGAGVRLNAKPSECIAIGP